MVFNLREAGTEVHEGTMEWHSRIERERATMQLQQFRIPKTTGNRDSLSDSLDDLGTTGGAEWVTSRHETACSIGVMLNRR